MKTIGLVGGIASGKSRVAEELVRLGAGVLDADRVGHEVLANDPEVRQAIESRWGKSVFRADGSVDRKAIAARVFGQTASAIAEREFLESLLHPRIRLRLEMEAAKMAESGKPAVVLDAPLLLEAGWKPMCDVVLFVDASRATRLARALERGWTEAQFDQREAAQWPIDRKRAAAGYVIQNNGTESELACDARQLWQQFIVSSN